MNTPNPRQIAHRLNRLRAKMAAAPPVMQAKTGFWHKFMFYAKGGYDTPDGPVLPARATVSATIDQATVAAPYTLAAPKAAKLAVTPKSVAGFLFMPQIGQSLQSLGFAWVLLIQMIAGILVSNRLLPVDHPATTYRGAQQSKLVELFRTARQNFSFRWQDAPRAVVWVSLVAFIFVVGGLLTSAAAKLVFTTAHAQTATATSGAPSNAEFKGDVASLLIDNFFGFGAYANGGVPAINTLISTFNNMILLFGGVILILTIISVVAETARTGVPFGKNFNPVWAPVRLIIAIAFMVPLSNNLSAGQNILLSLVKWSSNYAANQVWGNFSKTVFSGENSISGVMRDTTAEGTVVYGDLTRQTMVAYNNYLFCQRTTEADSYGDCPGDSTPKITGMSANVQRQAGELYLHPQLYVMPVSREDYKLATASGAQNSILKARVVRLVNPATRTKNTPITAQALADGEQLAGYIEVHAYDLATYMSITSQGYGPFPTGYTPPIVPAPVSIAVDGTNPVNNALQRNYNSFMQQHLALQNNGLGKQIAAIAFNSGSPENISDDDDDKLETVSVLFKNISDAFEAKRDADVKDAINKFKDNITNESKPDQILSKQLNAYGWVGAPIFIGQLGQLNADFQDATRAVPRPVIADKDNTISGSLMSYVKGWMAEIDRRYPLNFALGSAWWDKDLASSNNDLSNQTLIGQDKLHLILASAVFDVSNPNCNYGTLGGCEIHDNPLIHLASVGKFITQAMVDAFFRPNLLKNDGQPLNDNAGVTAQEIRANTVKECDTAIVKPAYCDAIYADLNDMKNKQMNARAVGMNLIPFGIPFLTFGFMLGFFLPLLPMFRYLLGFLGWLLLLFEAILAIPLLGIGHLKTDGEGLIGPMNQGGYLMILGLLIKPVLMVIGLICGLVIFNGAVQVTAYTLYPLIFKEQNTVFFAFDMLLFASFITVLGNSAFKTIDIIPNSVISWIGGRMDTKTDDAAGVQSNALNTVSSLGQSISFTQGTPNSLGPRDPKTPGGSTAGPSSTDASNSSNSPGALINASNSMGSNTGTGGASSTLPALNTSTVQRAASNTPTRADMISRSNPASVANAVKPVAGRVVPPASGDVGG